MRFFQAVAVLFAVAACVSAAAALDLTPADISWQWGNGPDGTGNTADDSWQFWYGPLTEADFHRLDTYYTAPTGGVPDGPTAAGWVLSHDWSPTYEGVWGNTTTGEIYVHPYQEKTDGGKVAISFQAPDTDVYNIAGSLTDQNPAFSDPSHNGIAWQLEKADGSGAFVQTIASGGPFGDDIWPVDAPTNTVSFSSSNVSLIAGDHVRLVIDPFNEDSATMDSGSDMTQINYFTINKASGNPIVIPGPAPEPEQPEYAFNTYPTGDPNLVVLAPPATEYNQQNYAISSGGSGTHIGLTDVTFTASEDVTVDKLFFQICDMNTGGRFHMDLFVDGALQAGQTTYVDAIASGVALVDLEWDIVNLELLAEQTVMIRFDHDRSMAGSSSTAARLHQYPYYPLGGMDYPDVYGVFSAHSQTTPVSLLVVPIPEPASAVFLICGLAAMIARKRRSRKSR